MPGSSEQTMQVVQANPRFSALAARFLARPWPVCLLVFALAFLLRIALVARGTDFVDRAFLPDDTYYSLSIARHIALGHGPTADGTVLTNGFQPFITFLQVPFFFFSDDRDRAVLSAVCETALFGACTAALLTVLLAHASSPRAGLIAGLIAALDPAIIRNDLNGLETSLSGLLCLSLIGVTAYAACRASTPRAGLFGAISGLALLARIDSLFVILACCVVLRTRLSWPGFLKAGLCGMLSVGPWFCYGAWFVGKPIPESGSAVHQIAGYHLLSESTAKPLIMGLADLGRLVPLPGLPVAALTCVGLMLVIGAVLVVTSVMNGRVSFGRMVAVAASAALAYLLFYILYLPATWFFTRYFHFVYLTIIAIGALGCDILLDASGRMSRAGRASVVAGLAAIGIAFTAVSARQYGDFLVGVPQFGTFEGAKGYGATARRVLAQVPDHSVLAAMQSGALGYYARPGLRVVNLDGVVNHHAYRAIRDRRLASYMKQNGATFFADWKANFAFLVWASAADTLPQFAPLLAADPQGRDETTLYRVTWP